MGAIYTGLFLDEFSRDCILELFPAKHENVYADHVTLAFKPSQNAVLQADTWRGSLVECFVLAHVHDEKGQALWLGCTGLKNVEVTQEILHLTISCAEGTSPVYSNELLKKSSVGREILCRFMGFLRVCRTEDKETTSQALWKRRGLPLK